MPRGRGPTGWPVLPPPAPCSLVSPAGHPFGPISTSVLLAGGAAGLWHSQKQVAIWQASQASTACASSSWHPNYGHSWLISARLAWGSSWSKVTRSSTCWRPPVKSLLSGEDAAPFPRPPKSPALTCKLCPLPCPLSFPTAGPSFLPPYLSVAHCQIRTTQFGGAPCTAIVHLSPSWAKNLFRHRLRSFFLS